MRTLLVLRHAKSSWKDEGLADHDRPLNKRGKKNAPTIGKLIRKEGLTPSWIASSTALRARKTAEAAAKGSGYSGTIHYTRELYLAQPGDICAVLRKTAPESATRILIVGHNPGLEELVGAWTAQRQPFPTGALAQIDLAIESWSELSGAVRGELVHLWCPRDLD
ncbi:MAG: SixA phosphatase family protein [Vicinamibacteria bacterium]